MIAHARHQRHPVEDIRRPQEKVIPVGAFISPVHEVASNQKEIDVGMPAIGGTKKLAPALKTGLRITQVKKTEVCARGSAPS